MHGESTRWGGSQAHTRSHYDADGDLRSRADARQKLHAFDRSLSNLETDCRVLEIGAYHGLVHSLQSGQAVGIDPLTGDWSGSSESPAHCVTGIGEALPFETDAFDVVFTWNTLDHVLDPSAVLDETRRTLTPDGELLLCVNVYDVPELIHEHVISRLNKHHPHYFRPRDVRALLLDAGFALEMERLAEPPVDPVASARSGDIMTAGSALCGLTLYQIRARPRGGVPT